MRWNEDPLETMEGHERTIEVFLTFPTTIDGETRWLETAQIVQRVVKVDVGDHDQWGYFKHKWMNWKWAD